MYTFPEGDTMIVIKFITTKTGGEKEFCKKNQSLGALSAPRSKQPTIPHTTDSKPAHQYPYRISHHDNNE
jgi:hypothetical protein